MVKLQRRRKFGHQVPEEEYCRGYFDDHDQWNNGFKCPKWGGPDIKTYCCGPDTHRYCCTKDDIQEKPPPPVTATEVSVYLGIAVGCLVLVSISAILTCYFCQCCWVYKKRKRHSQGIGGCGQHPHVTGGRSIDYAVNYSVCPHQSYLADSQNRPPGYPLDDPPPYPGDIPYTSEEKQPLNPTDLYVTQEGPDDPPVTLPLTSDSVPHPMISLDGTVCNGYVPGMANSPGSMEANTPGSVRSLTLINEPSSSHMSEYDADSNREIYRDSNVVEEPVCISGVAPSCSLSSVPHTSSQKCKSSGNLDNQYSNGRVKKDYTALKSTSSPQLSHHMMDLQDTGTDEEELDTSVAGILNIKAKAEVV